MPSPRLLPLIASLFFAATASAAVPIPTPPNINARAYVLIDYQSGRVLAGEPSALIDQIGEIAGCGVEHLVLEFLSEDGRALDEQMDAFASEVRPAF